MIETIIFYLLLVDSIFANLASWTGFGKKWYEHTFFVTYLPLAKGWTIVYFALVLWVGSLLSRMGLLVF